jgi:hypothetical protein
MRLASIIVSIVAITLSVADRRTGVADAGVVDLDANFVCLGRCHFNVLDAQLLAGLPCNGGLVELVSGDAVLCSGIAASNHVDMANGGPCGIDSASAYFANNCLSIYG